MEEWTRAAIEAVARHVAATGAAAGGDAVLTVAGRRLAVAVARLDPRPAERAAPRLRFDRVALRVVGRLRAALSPHVPDGEAVIVTVTAPIRLPAKTAAALEATIRDGLAAGPPPPDLAETIHGNRVRVRFAAGGPPGAPAVIGFVHNPETDPAALLGTAQSLVAGIGAAAGAPVPDAAERWLAVAGGALSEVETSRHACAQLPMPAGFGRILMVLPDGAVETLAG